MNPLLCLYSGTHLLIYNFVTLSLGLGGRWLSNLSSIVKCSGQ